MDRHSVTSSATCRATRPSGAFSWAVILALPPESKPASSLWPTPSRWLRDLSVRRSREAMALTSTSENLRDSVSRLAISWAGSLTRSVKDAKGENAAANWTEPDPLGERPGARPTKEGTEALQCAAKDQFPGNASADAVGDPLSLSLSVGTLAEPSRDGRRAAEISKCHAYVTDRASRRRARYEQDDRIAIEVVYDIPNRVERPCRPDEAVVLQSPICEARDKCAEGELPDAQPAIEISRASSRDHNGAEVATARLLEERAGSDEGHGVGGKTS
jgi:hypothetical protein